MRSPASSTGDACLIKGEQDEPEAPGPGGQLNHHLRLISVNPSSLYRWMLQLKTLHV